MPIQQDFQRRAVGRSPANFVNRQSAQKFEAKFVQLFRQLFFPKHLTKPPHYAIIITPREREVNKMPMKCPYCGSTAQPKLTCPPFISRETKLLTEGWTCGCGCHFIIEYRRNSKGIWNFHNKYIEYMEERK
jgi:hypothetical protein